MKRYLVMVICALQVSAGMAAVADRCSATGPSDEQRLAARTLLTDRYPDGPNPGVSVLASCDGKALFSFNSGMANIEWKQPIGSSTSFRVGSISKSLTAVAILQLVESGRIELDRPISSYVPLLPEYMRPVTVRQLMSHTSGLPDILLTPALLPLARDWVALSQIIGMQGKTPPREEPGQSFEYSNFNYVLLAALIESVTGTPYGEYMEQRVFEPRGLHRTHYDRRRAILAERAEGYELSLFGELLHSENIDMSHASAAGALLSSTENLALWTHLLLSGELLAPETLEAAWSGQELPDGTTTAYGLGFNLGEQFGRRVIWHTGLASGFQAAWSVYPDEGLSVIVLANGFHLPNPTKAMDQVAEILLRGPER